ncbi:unnamed protein product [Gadus morhua 'NCC']
MQVFTASTRSGVPAWRKLASSQVSEMKFMFQATPPPPPVLLFPEDSDSQTVIHDGGARARQEGPASITVRGDEVRLRLAVMMFCKY